MDDLIVVLLLRRAAGGGVCFQILAFFVAFSRFVPPAALSVEGISNELSVESISDAY